MATNGQKIYTQFYTNSLSEDMITAGKRSNSVYEQAYKDKSCAYYFNHSTEDKSHTLDIYILPTDDPNAKGVQCTMNRLANMPLPGMASLMCSEENGEIKPNEIPYLVRHPYLGDICVLPRYHIREGFYKMHTELLQLDSTSHSAKDISDFLKRMRISCDWHPNVFYELGVFFSNRLPGQSQIDQSMLQRQRMMMLRRQRRLAARAAHRRFLNMPHRQGAYDDDDDDDANSVTRNEDNPAPGFIAEILGIGDGAKPECFKEFEKVFSLSCLYVEYQICKSLKQQGIHGMAKCMLCERISQNGKCREIKPVWTEERKDTHISHDVLLKTELLFNLKAIGYNIYGSCLVINETLYSKPTYSRYEKMRQTPLYAAIAEGGVSWIKALMAAGIELNNDFPDGALVKFTLDSAPTSKQHTILKLLEANGAALAEDTYEFLSSQAANVIQQNNHRVLQWIIDTVSDRKPDLMSLIDLAAGVSHHKCLKVGASDSGLFYSTVNP